MRVEVRSVAPDANPYMVMLSIFKTGINGDTAKIKNLRQAERYLPDNIYDAWRISRRRTDDQAFGRGLNGTLCRLEKSRADRCPRLLGTFVKAPEVQVPPRRIQPVPLEHVLGSKVGHERATFGNERGFFHGHGPTGQTVYKCLPTMTMFLHCGLCFIHNIHLPQIIGVNPGPAEGP